jgi:GT2 family glycosyltransferase
LLRRVQAGQPLGLRRDEILVCIPVFGALEDLRGCLDSVLRHTDPAVPILVADDCSPEPGVEELLSKADAAAAGRTVFWWRQERNAGFPRNCNDSFAAAAPADVVVLNSDCQVAEGWLDSLHEAAYSDSVVASATPLTNNGTIVSVPDRNRPDPALPEGMTLDEVAGLIGRESLRLRPLLPTAIGHCTYFKRSALELVGGFDEVYSPGYGEEVDWSQRCVQRGLGHVLADDVFVFHKGSGSFSAATARLQEEHHRLNTSRFPYYERWVRQAAASEYTPLARSLAQARRSLRGLTITIDGSSLGPTVTGTQVQTLETVMALQRQGAEHLRVAVPRRLGEYARDVLTGIGVELIVWEDVDGRHARTDVVHRAAQVGRAHEFRKLQLLADYVVISQLDLIAYRNPGYFDTVDEWQAYRRATELALGAADQVLFSSEHARGQALAEGLVEEDRARVIPLGVDHQVDVVSVPPTRPEWAGTLERGFVLCLGTDFHHKNRLFALEVAQEMQRRGWAGTLVLAGPQASPGSSRRQEDEWLRARPELAGQVLRGGHLADAERRWLFLNAGLVLSPSVYEGFGLVPFEAADFGVPVLFAPQASLGEVLPASTARLLPWDVREGAARALELLRDSAASQALVEEIRSAARSYTWDDHARRLLEVYRGSVRRPPRSGWVAHAAGSPEDGAPTSDFRILAPEKVVRYWRDYGVWDGSRRGYRALRNRLGRRLERRRLSRSTNYDAVASGPRDVT